MVVGLVKMRIFDFNLDELVKDAEEATDLNNVIKKITKENSYQLIDELLDKYNINWSVISGQVVGAEVDNYGISKFFS
jgi:hypothetical protein